MISIQVGPEYKWTFGIWFTPVSFISNTLLFTIPPKFVSLKLEDMHSPQLGGKQIITGYLLKQNHPKESVFSLQFIQTNVVFLVYPYRKLCNFPPRWIFSCPLVLVNLVNMEQKETLDHKERDTHIICIHGVMSLSLFTKVGIY